MQHGRVGLKFREQHQKQDSVAYKKVVRTTMVMASEYFSIAEVKSLALKKACMSRVSRIFFLQIRKSDCVHSQQLLRPLHRQEAAPLGGPGQRSWRRGE